MSHLTDTARELRVPHRDHGPGFGTYTSMVLKGPLMKKQLNKKLFFGAPTGIRTPVLALKGPRPGPLDDGGAWLSE